MTKQNNTSSKQKEEELKQKYLTWTDQQQNKTCQGRVSRCLTFQIIKQNLIDIKCLTFQIIKQNLIDIKLCNFQTKRMSRTCLKVLNISNH